MTYQQLLRDILQKQGITEYRSLDEIMDPLYEVVGMMLDEKEPRFVRDVARELVEGVFPGKNYNERANVDNLTSFLGKFPKIIHREYGIGIIAVEEALRLVYPKIEEVHFGSYKDNIRRINSRSDMLFKSEDKLKQYILDHTTKKENIVIRCNFPVE